MKRKLIFIIVIGFFLIIQPLSSQTWEKTKRLTWTPGKSWLSDITTDSNGNIHVVWIDDSLGIVEIFYKKSTDGGGNWTTRRLTWSVAISTQPKILTDSSDNIHVVFSDASVGTYEVYHKKSTNGGDNWNTKRITWDTNHSLQPDFAIDSNDTIHVVWGSSLNDPWELYYKKSTDIGNTWTSGKRLTWNSGTSVSPSICTDSNNNIFVVWTDTTPGNEEIFFKKSTNQGNTWITKRLTWTSTLSRYPKIAIDSHNNVYICWQEIISSNKEIFLTKSTDGGLTWSSKRLTWNLCYSVNPNISIDLNDNIHLIYSSDIGNYELFYRRSTNGGTSWTSKRLTWNLGDSHPGVITTDLKNKIHIIWEDDTPVNKEIFYKKGIQ